MKKMHQDVYIGLVMVLFAGWATAYGGTIRGEPGVVPKALAVIMLIFGAYVLVSGVRKTARGDGAFQYSLSWSRIDVSVFAYAAVLAYVGLFYVLGYFSATLLFLVGMMRFLKVGSWKKILMISLVTVVCLYVLFVVLFSVNMSRIGCLI